ncbi:MAG: glycoside hydrolase family 3 N-terminal domain-containing protein [Polyangiaceae bacterium]
MPPPNLPPMRLVGRAGRTSLAREAGLAIGARLFDLGFNLDFAPILDVDSNPANPVIGDRSFSAEAPRAAELAVAFQAGLGDGAILSCGKHFPGHGDTDKDSHFDLPVVSADRARLEAVELVPFVAAIAANVDSIMTAHILLKAIDPERPATLSRVILEDLLRHQLKFDGVIVSDDLEMRALAAKYAVAESAILAIEAGCDLLLVCKSEDDADAAVEAVTREAEKSAAFAARVRESAARVRSMRRRAASLAARGPLSRPALADVIARIQAAALPLTELP